jgi:hypothetical protein
MATEQLVQECLELALMHLKLNKDRLPVTGDCIRIPKGEDYLDLLVTTWGFKVGDNDVDFFGWALLRGPLLGEYPSELKCLRFEVLSFDRDLNQAVLKLRTEV